MKNNRNTTRQAINFAWTTFKTHYRLLIAILLVVVGAWIALEVLVIAGQSLGVMWWLAAHLGFLVIVAGIAVGFLHTCLALYDGEAPTLRGALGYLAAGPEFLVGQILYGSLTIIGLVVFIVPGLYWGARYAFLGFCQVEGGKNMLLSFRESARLSTGKRIELLTILGSLLILNVVGACMLGIGLLITIPLSTLFMTAIYRQGSESNLFPQDSVKHTVKR